jgi:secondary thiamine-phosphate synthase enzyme
MYWREIKLNIEEKLEFVDITDKIKRIVKESKVKEGLVNIYTKHTTSAIRINENEPFLIEDMKHFLEYLVPSSARYKHDDIANRNCPPNERINGHSHLKALLLGTSETIPIKNYKLCLGKWQSIFYVDLDGGNRKRKVLVQILGK